jgi:hypothetical protein
MMATSQPTRANPVRSARANHKYIPSSPEQAADDTGLQDSDLEWAEESTQQQQRLKPSDRKRSGRKRSRPAARAHEDSAIDLEEELDDLYDQQEQLEQDLIDVAGYVQRTAVNG